MSQQQDQQGDAQDAFSREVTRIEALDDYRLRDEIVRMVATNWAAGRLRSDEVLGADRVADAYLARLGRPIVGERAYLALLRRILDYGSQRTDRTGTGTYSVFGATMRFDLRDGFPLVTTKRVPIASVIRELLWFLRGSTNIRDLGCKIWDEWADERGDVGPVYGYQWRRWGVLYARWQDYEFRRSEYARRSPEEQARREREYEEAVTRDPGGDHGIAPHFPATQDDYNGGPAGVDQIAQALDQIKRTPDSRRILVSAWNVADVPQMRLPCCHLLFQFYVDDGHLDCQMYQRSADMALGVPFNIASYALLLAMFARECRLTPRYLTVVLGDAHIYANHVDGIRLQLTRDPLPSPRLVLADKDVLAQTLEDIQIVDYQHHPAIRFEVSV